MVGNTRMTLKMQIKMMEPMTFRRKKLKIKKTKQTEGPEKEREHEGKGIMISGLWATVNLKCELR